MVIVMAKKISYVVMSVIYFNLFFLFSYYFKIVDFMSNNFNVLNIIVANLLVVIFDAFYILFFNVLKVYKLSYLWCVISSVFIGFIISFIIFKTNYNFNNYLSVISFFTINFIFLNYSLRFEKEKNNVFN